MSHLIGQPSCTVIGDNALTLQCAKYLLEQKFTLVGVVTQLPALIRWAEQQGIPCYPNLKGLENASCYDYLFSIVNPWVLPRTLLKQARLMAINYHDSPLPRYAGVHATSWVILNGETHHGVTWHRMTAQVDAGDLLTQTTFPLTGHETAQQLNQHCFIHALKLFEKLVKQLKTGTLEPKTQPLQHRTYYSLHQKPEAAAYIQWSQPAQIIERLFRACHLGAIDNTFAACQCWFGENNSLTIGKLELTQDRSNVPPGTVVAIKQHYIQVATSTYDVRLMTLTNFQRKPLKPHVLMRHLSLKAGQRLPLISTQQAKAWHKEAVLLSQYEAFWLGQLQQANPLAWPGVSVTPGAKTVSLILKSHFSCKSLNFPAAHCDNPLHSLFTLVLTYLYRMTGKTQLDLAYYPPTISSPLQGPFWPLNLTLHCKPLTFANLNKTLQQQLQHLKQHLGLSASVLQRYPKLSLPRYTIAIVSDDFDVKQLVCHETMVFQINTNTLSIDFYVDKSLAHEVSCQHVAAHLQQLTQGLREQPHQSLNQWPLVSAYELALFKQINQTTQPYPHDKTISQLFEAQAAKTPNHIALEFNDQSMAYHELNERANQVAHYLIAKGVTPGCPIALYFDRGFDMIVAILGVLKAGGIYIPILLNLPKKRRISLIQSTNTNLLLTNQSPLLNFDNFVKVISFNTLKKTLRNQSLLTNPIISTYPNQPACILFTSGSTGISKGVQLTHKNFINVISFLSQEISITDQDKILSLSEYTFDASVWNLFSALFYGGSLVICSKPCLFPGKSLAVTLARYKITVAFIPTSVLTQTNPVQNIKLKALFTGGELTSNDNLKQWKKVTHHLFHMYGPTEAAVYTTFFKVRTFSTFPIGQPIANVQVHVLDQHRQPVPVGVPGELYIGGAGVSLGYLNEPELTKQVFIEHTFAEGHTQRLYKTGDCVRWLPEGNLDYLARMDTQLKLRGYRIEAGEIETHLAQFPGIQQAVVVKRRWHHRHEQLVAFYTTQTSQSITARKLALWLQRVVPDYMVPAAFIYVDSLPLTPHGKLNRNALMQRPCLEDTHKEVSIEAAQPTTPYQHLKLLWQQLLNVEDMQADDSFFSLGGDSILAIQCVTQAKQLGLQLSLKQLFDTPTLQALATSLEQQATQKCKPLKQHLQWNRLYPLTPIQHWFFEQAFAKPHAWAQVIQFQLTTQVSLKTLQHALHRTLQQHPSFKLRFKSTQQGWQQIYDKVDYAGQFIHRGLQPTSPQQRQNLTQQLLARLNINTGPLLQAHITTDAQDLPTQLLIAIHHLIVDGISWRIIHDDLLHFLNEPDSTERDPTVKTALPFGLWAEAMNRQVKQLPSDTVEYWTEQAPKLINAPVWPNRCAALENTQAHMTCLTQTLSLTHTETMRHFSQAGISTFELLLTVFASACQQTLHFDSLLVHLESHGRHVMNEAMDVSNTLGWFTSLHPWVLPCGDTQDLKRLYQIIHQALKYLPNKGQEFGSLRYLSSQTPLKKALSEVQPTLAFNYLGKFGSEHTALTFEQFELVSHPNNHRPHVLDVQIWQHQDTLSLAWTYPKTHADAAVIQQLATTYFSTLQRLLEQPDTLIQNSGPNATLLPLTSLQQGLLYHSLLDHQSPCYLVQTQGIIEQTIELTILKQSYLTLVDCYPILRAQFESTAQGAYQQRFLSHAVCEPILKDWSALNDKEQKSQWQKYLQHDRQQSFHLDKAPLHRLTLIRCASNQVRWVWTFHHSVLDGWSMMLLLKQWQACYLALTQQQPYRPIKSLDFATYVSQLQSLDTCSSQDYWHSLLATCDGPTELPSGVNSVGNLADPQAHSLVLSQSFSQRLNNFAKQHHLTPNALFQTAWAVLLSRYTQSSQVVYGTMVSGRHYSWPNVEQTIGLCTQTLPIFLDLSPDLPPLEVMQRLQAQLLTSLQHSHLSLNDIQAQTSIPSQTPLITSLCVFENYFKPATQSNALFDLQQIEIWDPTHYEWTLLIQPSQQYTLLLRSFASHTSDALAGRLLQHLQHLLHAFMNQSNLALSQMAYLTQEELQQLDAWNQTTTPLPEQTIDQLFEQQARQHPTHPAILSQTGTLSYQALSCQSNQLAQVLRIQYKVKSRDRVAFSLPRSTERLILIYAILKTGACFVPIDSELPFKRVELIVKDAAPKILVAATSLLEQLNSNPIHPTAVSLDHLLKEAKTHPKTPLHVLRSLHDPIYIIYTSGSTGAPKGVVNHHLGISNRITWMQRHSFLSSSDRVLHKTNIGFDVATWEYAWPLSYGAQTVIAPTITYLDADQLAQIIRQYAITHLHFVPTVLQNFLSINHQKRSINTVQHLFTSGEILTPALAKDLFEVSPNTTLHNLYGPTEAAIDVTFHVIKEPQIHTSFLPIGRPIDNLQLHVLDQHQQRCPIGIPGELYIGGVGVALGYLNRPDLNKTSFLPSPFDHNQRLYRTGDKVVWNEEGELLYLGRLDTQVKLRGVRIELQEIEHQLRQQASIQQAFVHVLHPNTPHAQLVAYCVATPEFEDLQVKRTLADTLPNTFIPHHFILLDHLPTTSSGKIDARTLTQAADTLAKAPSAFVAPITQVQCTVASLWQTLLQRKAIGLHDHFFECGGHSLLVLQVLARIQQIYSVTLPIQTLIQHPTLLAFCEAIESAQDKQNADQTSMLVPLNTQQSDKPTLFLVHPVGGTIFWFVPLARQLEKKYNCIGLQDPGIAAGSFLFDTFEQLATHYCHTIQQTQPQGPYLLAGASFGATVAFAIAHQLVQQQQTVSFVGLLDGWAHYPECLLQRTFFQNIMQEQHQRLKEAFHDKQLEQADAWLELQSQRQQLLFDYALPATDLSLTLFRAQALLPLFKAIDDPTHHWQHYTSQSIQTVLVPGDHETMFNQNNAVALAEALQDALLPYNNLASSQKKKEELLDCRD